MEHLPLPRGKKHLKIPNLALETYTRKKDVPWADYPQSRGWTSEQLRGDDNFGGRSTAEVQSFFQVWLYFGTVIEVLAIVGVHTKYSDFLDPTGKFVSTRKLPGFILKWKEKVGYESPESAISPKKLSDFTAKICRILKTVNNLIQIYNESRNGTSQKPSVVPVTELTWISMNSLYHALTLAMCEFHETPGHSGHFWASSNLLKSHILMKGWCPSDVEAMMEDLSIDGHYYIASLDTRIGEGNISHDICTPKVCKARTVNPSTYRQVHNPPCTGDCNGSIATDVQSVMEIVEKGQVPVHRWDPVARVLKVKGADMLRRGKAEPSYIVLSHVWSDGLGNLKENSLLQCQLDEIQKYIDTLSGWEGLKGQPQYFWLDTLCIPVGPSPERRKIRKMAIGQMAHIYAAASAVLVISSSFKAIKPSGSASIDNGLGSYLANWNRRLWTFQEGMLASKLVFLYADGEMEFSQNRPGTRAGRLVEGGCCVDFPFRCVEAMGLFYFFPYLRRDNRAYYLRNPVPSFSWSVKRRYEMLSGAMNSMRRRSTSWLSDQTLCVGTSLSMNVKRLVAVEQEMRIDEGVGDREHVDDARLSIRRMKVFLKIQKVVQRGIIFNSEPRIDEDGYRWAPASFLGFSGDRDGTFLNSKAIVSENGRGLYVKGGGASFTIDESTSIDHDTPIIVSIKNTRAGMEPIKLRVCPIQPPSSTRPFGWRPGGHYGIILDWDLETVADDLNQLNRFFGGHSLDSSFPSDEFRVRSWFEKLFESINPGSVRFTAVLGDIKARFKPSVLSQTDRIQIVHNCLAAVTLLNPESVLHLKTEVHKDPETPQLPKHLKLKMGKSLIPEEDPRLIFHRFPKDTEMQDSPEGWIDIGGFPVPSVRFAPGYEDLGDLDGAFSRSYLDPKLTKDFDVESLAGSEDEKTPSEFESLLDEVDESDPVEIDESSSDWVDEQSVQSGNEIDDLELEAIGEFDYQEDIDQFWEALNSTENEDEPSDWEPLYSRGNKLPEFVTATNHDSEKEIVLEVEGTLRVERSGWYIL
ncbi:hypothetical protein EYR41_000453 [Orbilia oligospora]|uniref:Uncharacterized protein n=1 Tax=Orbilia oligospora TaxID=2813651 RepID=A0A7C8K702_ORBOL|nr:hypothetical protein TWF751_009000 [Orbilia oligospora]TGJ73353.1 hypothetical protein EYR41_000453 [Orbilia oligospora]